MYVWGKGGVQLGINKHPGLSWTWRNVLIGTCKLFMGDALPLSLLVIMMSHCDLASTKNWKSKSCGWSTEPQYPQCREYEKVYPSVSSFRVLHCPHPEWWCPRPQYFFLQSQLADVALFLLWNMDWLVTVIGCPQLYLLNIVQKTMEIIKRGLFGLFMQLNMRIPKLCSYVLRKSKYKAQTQHKVEGDHG